MSEFRIICRIRARSSIVEGKILAADLSEFVIAPWTRWVERVCPQRAAPRMLPPFSLSLQAHVLCMFGYRISSQQLLTDGSASRLHIGAWNFSGCWMLMLGISFCVFLRLFVGHQIVSPPSSAAFPARRHNRSQRRDAPSPRILNFLKLR